MSKARIRGCGSGRAPASKRRPRLVGRDLLLEDVVGVIEDGCEVFDPGPDCVLGFVPVLLRRVDRGVVAVAFDSKMRCSTLT